MAITTIDIIGDSESAGTIFGFAQSSGGRGSYPEFVSQWLGNIPAVGPLLSPGFRGVMLGIQPFATEWTYQGAGWNNVVFLTNVTATHGGTTTAFTKASHGLANGTAVVPGSLSNTLGGAISNNTTYFVVNTATNTFGLASTVGGAALALGGASNDTTATIGMSYDKLPQGYCKFGNGSTSIATWALPKNYQPIVGFDYWWIDISGGGNPSYSLDGGTTWTTFTETLQHDNAINKCYISQPITSSGFQVRMADSSGTTVQGMPVGITPYWIAPQGRSNGIILNNFATNGGTLRLDALTTPGDRLAILDSVRLGSGSPISSNPNICLILHINDVALFNATQWGTDHDTVNARVKGVGGVCGYINCWEVEHTDYDITQQGLYRAQVKTTANASSPVVPVLDIYDQWVALGLADVTAQGALFMQDNLHPNQAGNQDIAHRVYWWMLKNFFSLGITCSIYTAKASIPVPAYIVAQLTPAYSAAGPIGIDDV